MKPYKFKEMFADAVAYAKVVDVRERNNGTDIYVDGNAILLSAHTYAFKKKQGICFSNVVVDIDLAGDVVVLREKEIYTGEETLTRNNHTRVADLNEALHDITNVTCEIVGETKDGERFEIDALAFPLGYTEYYPKRCVKCVFI